MPAIFTEEEFAALANFFAAMPNNLEHKFPNDPSTYAKAMVSEHTSNWTAALQDEFDSLRDLVLDILT
jgi:threonine synthase